MAIGLSMIIGPAVGPSLQKIDVHYPLHLSMLFLGVSLLIGYVQCATPPHQSTYTPSHHPPHPSPPHPSPPLPSLFLSESLAPQHRGAFSWAKSNPFLALRAALRYRRFVLFSGPFCLSQLAECVYQFVVLYTQKRFGWSYTMLGLYISATGIFLALVQVRPSVSLALSLCRCQPAMLDLDPPIHPRALDLHHPHQHQH